MSKPVDVDDVTPSFMVGTRASKRRAAATGSSRIPRPGTRALTDVKPTDLNRD